MEESAITAEGIQKSYQTGTLASPVLKGIDFTVPLGETLFLAGPSGSGKTTLLSILGCVLSPDTGRLEILGQDVTHLSRNDQARFRRERIGFVFQRYHLFAGMNAWENVRIAFDLLGKPKRESKRESLRLLDLVGLSHRANHQISQLSMGQRQRVAIARALAGDPELILADEPTASLDAESGQNAMAILKRLCDELGKTVVVVTHDDRIFHLADRILTLVDGRIATSQQLSATSDTNPTTPPLAATA